MMPPNMMGMPPQMRPPFPIYNIPMTMKQPRMMQPINMRPMMNIPQPQQQQVDPFKMDKNARADYFGEQLFTKISRSPAFTGYANYFSKIVGIFLDLEDNVIDKLIKDDKYFHQQVQETIKLLTEKENLHK